MWKSLQKSKFRASKMATIAIFELLKFPNSISRKFFVMAVKFLNFHTVPLWQNIFKKKKKKKKSPTFFQSTTNETKRAYLKANFARKKEQFNSMFDPEIHEALKKRGERRFSLKVSFVQKSNSEK